MSVVSTATMNTLLAVCLNIIGLAAAKDVYVATSIMEAPYVTQKEGVQNATKLEDFEGYIPDLLQQISHHSNKKFNLKIVGDGKYGAKIDGSWNGMIGEVIHGQADVAAAPITVSPERSEVVDFTDHFMTFDTIVLLKKMPGMPRIRSAAELFNNTDIKCGVVMDGFTENFFKTTQQDIYKQIYEKMKKDRDDFPRTSSAGVKKVRDGNGKYAFIMESSTADYWMNKKSCDLVSFRLGSALPYHDYSFAVKRGNHELKDLLNSAIRYLKSKGEHDVLRAKWWPTDCSSASHLSASLMSALLAAFVLSSKRL